MKSIKNYFIPQALFLPSLHFFSDAFGQKITIISVSRNVSRAETIFFVNFLKIMLAVLIFFCNFADGLD